MSSQSDPGEPIAAADSEARLRALEQLVGELRALVSEEPSSRWAPPGHFYSPLPAAAEVAKDAARIFNRNPADVPGVDLRISEQLALVQDLAAIDTSLPWSADRDEHRYWHNNQFFAYGDGLFLYLLLRKLRPRHLIEVGSGFTSALILDVNDRYLERAMTCTFIEPFPDRLNELLRDDDRDRARVIQSRVQDVGLDVFETLGDGDVLFIDSTHVSKIGSDVNYLIFEVLPRLARGVVVHVHDVFPAFEYPRAWIEQGRAWNENYLLRAFLQFNSAFEIVLHANVLLSVAPETLLGALDLRGRNIGGSIWLRRR
jgi:predicted O-methyltransferase YrrM